MSNPSSSDRIARAAKPCVAVGNAERRHPLRPVRGEILDGQRAAGGGGAQRDPPAERAAVERVGAAQRDFLERRGEVGLHEALAREERGMKDAPERRAQVARRGRAEEIVGVGRLAALAGRGWKAVAGAGDGVFEERAPADPRAQRFPAQGVSFPPA
jgi:hypothetical protein